MGRYGFEQSDNDNSRYSIFVSARACKILWRVFSFVALFFRYRPSPANPHIVLLLDSETITDGDGGSGPKYFLFTDHSHINKTSRNHTHLMTDKDFVTF